jgi:hypothetical protein
VTSNSDTESNSNFLITPQNNNQRNATINGVVSSVATGGLTGLTVFLDKNGDGKLERGEPSTVTAADGSYAFTGLSAGTVRVGLVVPSGFLKMNPASGIQQVALANNNDTKNANFQVRPKSIKATLVSSRNSAAIGQPVQFMATVRLASNTAPPQGLVEFMQGPRVLGVASLVPGAGAATAIWSTSNLSAGNDSIVAVYVDPSNVIEARSAPRVVRVNKASTRIVLVATPNPSPQGNPLTLTAVVFNASQGVAPSGSVTLYDGRTILGTLPLVNQNGQSVATLITSNLKVGKHALRVNYSGDSANDASKSSALNVTILPKKG